MGCRLEQRATNKSSVHGSGECFWLFCETRAALECHNVEFQRVATERGGSPGHWSASLWEEGQGAGLQLPWCSVKSRGL